VEWLPTGGWTLKGNNAYFWCSRWPGEELAVGGLRTKVTRASLLAGGQPVAFEQTENRLLLKGLPKEQPDSIAGISVVRLECETPLKQVLGAGYVVLE
jgi:alpha-L-fucosidase